MVRIALLCGPSSPEGHPRHKPPTKLAHWEPVFFGTVDVHAAFEALSPRAKDRFLTEALAAMQASAPMEVEPQQRPPAPAAEHPASAVADPAAPAQPAGQPAVPAEQPDVPAEQPARPAEQPAAPAAAAHPPAVAPAAAAAAAANAQMHHWTNHFVGTLQCGAANMSAGQRIDAYHALGEAAKRLGVELGPMPDMEALDKVHRDTANAARFTEHTMSGFGAGHVSAEQAMEVVTREARALQEQSGAVDKLNNIGKPLGWGKAGTRLNRLKNFQQRLVAAGADMPEEQTAKRQKFGNGAGNKGNGTAKSNKDSQAFVKGPNYCAHCKRNTKNHNTETHDFNFRAKSQK